MRTIEKINGRLEHLMWWMSERSRLNKFKDIHTGQDCFIIGNGPSLNKMDLGCLNKYHCFGMNKIYLIFKRVKLDLSYLVAVNSLVIEQSKEAFESINCPVFLSYRASRGQIDSKEHIYRLMTTGGISWLFRDDIQKPVYEGVTVTFVALQLAYYMGFRRVFLVGVDHNFKQAGNPHEKQVMQGVDPNHFDPNYFSGKEWNLADLKGSELSYHLANYAFHRSGRKVYDATVGGKLQIFDKLSYEDALRTATKK